MNRSQAGTPGWYELSFNGRFLCEGEDMATFCIAARNLGAGAVVKEVRHPEHGHEPFGFQADGPALRAIAGQQ
jgi:hypothetical protein